MTQPSTRNSHYRAASGVLTPGKNKHYGGGKLDPTIYIQPTKKQLRCNFVIPTHQDSEIQRQQTLKVDQFNKAENFEDVKKRIKQESIRKIEEITDLFQYEF